MTVTVLRVLTLSGAPGAAVVVGRRDAMTGLLDRASFETLLDEAVEEAARAARPLALVLAWTLAPVLAREAGTLRSPLAEQAAYSVDALNVLLPHPYHPLWGPLTAERLQALPGNVFEKTAFFGWALPIALAFLAWRQRRDPALRPWLLLLAVFFLLSLGPALQWAGRPLLPLPGAWLGQVPGFAGSRAPGGSTRCSEQPARAAARTAATTARPKPTKTGSRCATATRVAGSVPLNASTPTRPSNRPRRRSATVGAGCGPRTARGFGSAGSWGSLIGCILSERIRRFDRQARIQGGRYTEDHYPA